MWRAGGVVGERAMCVQNQSPTTKDKGKFFERQKDLKTSRLNFFEFKYQGSVVCDKMLLA